MEEHCNVSQQAHLNEFPDYYTRLAEMESEAERTGPSMVTTDIERRHDGALIGDSRSRLSAPQRTPATAASRPSRRQGRFASLTERDRTLLSMIERVAV